MVTFFPLTYASVSKSGASCSGQIMLKPPRKTFDLLYALEVYLDMIVGIISSFNSGIVNNKQKEISLEIKRRSKKRTNYMKKNEITYH